MKSVRLLLTAALSMAANGVYADLERYNLGEDGESISIGEYSDPAQISQEGKYLLYVGKASNDYGTWRWNRETGNREKIFDFSIGNIGSLSLDGKKVVFSETRNVPDFPYVRNDVFVKDIDTGSVQRVNFEFPINLISKPKLSGNGRFLYYGENPIHVFDLVNGDQKTIDVPSNGAPLKASADGRYLLVSSIEALTLLDIEAGTQTVIAESENAHPMGWLGAYDLSQDGRYIVFAGNGAGMDRALRIFDRRSGQTSIVLTKASGENLTVYSSVSISGDGRYVAFTSQDNDLVENDYNGVLDSFVLDRESHEIARVSVNAEGEETRLMSGRSVKISADGHYVVFHTNGLLELGTTQQGVQGYVTNNPLYAPGYCKGYQEFSVAY